MRYLNLTFLPDQEWGYAFFVWLSTEEGHPLKRINDQLQTELLSSPEWRYIYQTHGYQKRSLVFETDTGEEETSGLVFPLISLFDFFIRDGFKEGKDPSFYYGDSFAYFRGIAKGIELLHQSHHFFPGLALPEVEGVLYPEARWFLNRLPLENSGLFKTWLHTIPRAVLGPKRLANFHIRQWLRLLLEVWSDQLLRIKLDGTALKSRLRGELRDAPLADVWLKALLSGDGTPYTYLFLDRQKIRIRDLQEQLFPKDKTSRAAIREYEAFQMEHLTPFIKPESLYFYLEPMDEENPFGDGVEWRLDLLVDGKRLTSNEHAKRRFLHLGDAPRGEEEKEEGRPDWERYMAYLPVETFSATEILYNYQESASWLTAYEPVLVEELRLPGGFSDEPISVSGKWVDQLLNKIGLLKRHGIGLRFPEWFKWKDYSETDVAIEANVETSQAFFSLDAIVNFKWQLSIGDLTISKDLFNQLVRENRRYINYRGEWVSVPLEQLSKAFERLSINGLELKDKGRVSDLLRFSLAETDEKSSSIHLNVDHLLERYLERLLSSTYSVPKVPSGLNGELRPYQKKGFGWLVNLKNKGVGGCLADDMGLGKTIQTITYLLYQRGSSPKREPALIVCPTSVMGNWASEIRHFAPDLSVILHHGANRSEAEQFKEHLSDTDVIITSYTLAVRDFNLLGEVNWSSLILDEAQAIKNPLSQKSRILKQYQASHRLALTGTPIENRLEELWAIMDFLNPGYLGSLTSFRRAFILPIEKMGNTERSELLKRLISPFLLRREKTDKRVIKDLPEKNELNIYCHLTEAQASMYQSIVDRLMERVKMAHGMERRGLILSTLTRLKQVCNHPDLITKEPGFVGESGKMNELLALLPPILDEKKSILIFTQYVKMG
ncbi:MAG TPA: SNF2-related protein, partial [Sporolactobacillaceae bacterium]|nr:SNF2-related protein [Sporolactobacillaceae bacterium]